MFELLKTASLELNQLDSHQTVKVANVLRKLWNWFKQLKNPLYREKVKQISALSYEAKSKLEELEKSLSILRSAISDADVEEYQEYLEKVKVLSQELSSLLGNLGEETAEAQELSEPSPQAPSNEPPPATNEPQEEYQQEHRAGYDLPLGTINQPFRSSKHLSQISEAHISISDKSMQANKRNFKGPLQRSGLPQEKIDQLLETREGTVDLFAHLIKAIPEGVVVYNSYPPPEEGKMRPAGQMEIKVRTHLFEVPGYGIKVSALVWLIDKWAQKNPQPVLSIKRITNVDVVYHGITSARTNIFMGLIKDAARGSAWYPKRNPSPDEVQKATQLLGPGWHLGLLAQDGNTQYRGARHPNYHGKPGTHPGVEVWTRNPEEGVHDPRQPSSDKFTPWKPDPARRASPEEKNLVLAEFEKRGWPRAEADAMIWTESGWDPTARNKQRFGGLIGFAPWLQKKWGVYPVWNLSAAQQAPLVGRYLDEVVPKGRHWTKPGDTYLTGAAPSFIGAPDNKIIYPRGSKAWEQNPGWRGPDGEITAGSIRAVVMRKVNKLNKQDTPIDKEMQQLQQLLWSGKTQEAQDLAQQIAQESGGQLNQQLEKALSQPSQPVANDNEIGSLLRMLWSKHSLEGIVKTALMDKVLDKDHFSILLFNSDHQNLDKLAVVAGNVIEKYLQASDLDVNRLSENCLEINGKLYKNKYNVETIKHLCSHISNKMGCQVDISVGEYCGE